MTIQKIENNLCFGCSPLNPIGLKLQFTEEGEICRSIFTAGSEYQGWPDCVHGGIISTLLDEVMAQWLWQRDIPAMTAEMTVRFIRPVPTGIPLTLESRNTGGRGKLYIMEGTLQLPDGSIACRATGKFMQLDGQ